ncbi:MAG: Plasmid stabilization system protein [Pelotomaculum sp. PtaU1.Bin035]|nr:MAG: Plasmid stabilization system protein [Pelotomaculum sp. PtaU1.Bin035]
MSKNNFYLTKQAAFDLQEITEYIARDSVENAIRFADELLEVCHSIQDFPERGRIVPEVGQPQIREVIHKNYRLVYAVRKGKIFILQVFNAARLFRMQDIETE